MIRHAWLLSLICLGLGSEVPQSSNLEIVLARCKEDLSWLDDLEYGSVTTVYDKCGVQDGPGRHITQPNVGREGGTFLRHIVDNYDKLADWTVFSQAEQPTYGYRGHRLGGGHMMNTVRFEDYVEASRNKDVDPSFFVFSTALIQTESALYQCFRKGYGEEYEVPVNGISRCGALQHWQRWVQFPDWFAVSVSKLQQEQGAPWPDFNLEATLQLFEVAPAERVLFFAQGARFAASREAIQSRPRDYYLKLLTHMEHADPWAGYFLEWMWFYVLTGEQAACGYEQSLAHAHVNLLAKGRFEITEAVSGDAGLDVNVSLITDITADVEGLSITFLTGSSTTVSVAVSFESLSSLTMELDSYLLLLASTTFRAVTTFLTGIIELSLGVTQSFEGDVECNVCKFGLSSGSVFAFGGSSVLLAGAEFYGVNETDTAEQTVTLTAGTAMKCAASTTTSISTPLTFSGSGTLSLEANSTFNVSADVSLDVATTMTSSSLMLGAAKTLSCMKPVTCSACAMDLADGSAVNFSGATATFSGATFNTSGDSTVAKNLTCAAGTALSITGTAATTIATALSVSGEGTLSCTGTLNVSADVSLDVATTMTSPSSLMLGAAKKLSCMKPVTCSACAMDLADGSAVALSGATATFSGATFTTSGDSTVAKNLTCAAGTALSFTGTAATTIATALSVSGAGTMSCEAGSILDLSADVSLDVATTMTSSSLKLGAAKKLSCMKPVTCSACAMDLADGSAVNFSGATATFSGATFSSTSGSSTVAKAISCAAGTVLSFTGAATSTISTALSISGAGTLSCEAGSMVAVAQDVAVAVAAKMTSSTMSLSGGKMVTFSNTMECTSCAMALADGSSLMLSGPTVSLSGAQFTGASGSAAAKAVTCAAGTVVSFLAGTTNTLSTALSFAGAGSLSFEASTILSVGAAVAVAVDSAFKSAAVNVAAGGALAYGAASVSVSGTAFALADATAALSFQGTSLTVGPAEGSSGTNITGSGSFSLSAGATLEIMEPLTIRVPTTLDSVNITHNTTNEWKFRGAPTTCRKCTVKGGGDVSFEGSTSVAAPSLALDDSDLEMDLSLEDASVSGSGKGTGSDTGRRQNRRTDLSGFVTVTYCGTAQTGALSLNSNSAVEFNLGCQVSGLPYSNTVSSLTYASGSIVAVIGVTTSSRPTLIQSLSSPSGLPLEVVISSLGSGSQTVTLIEYGNSGSCPTSFSAVIDNCNSGATCSVVGQTVNSSYCAIVLEQVAGTVSAASIGGNGSEDEGLYALFALLAIPLLLFLCIILMVHMKSKAAERAFVYRPPSTDPTAPLPTPAGSMAPGYTPTTSSYMYVP